MEQTNYINVRVRKDIHRKLKIVAAFSQESMLNTLDRLVSAEFDRWQRSQKGKAENAFVQEDQA